MAAFLVPVVRRDAQLGDQMHLLRANLELDHQAARRDDGRVERLVHVGLGRRDVVLEPLVHRGEEVVDHAEDPVAVGVVLRQNPHAEKIEDLLEEAALRLHLPVYGIEVLGPADHVGLDPE